MPVWSVIFQCPVSPSQSLGNHSETHVYVPFIHPLSCKEIHYSNTYNYLQKTEISDEQTRKFGSDFISEYDLEVKKFSGEGRKEKEGLALPIKTSEPFALLRACS